MPTGHERSHWTASLIGVLVAFVCAGIWGMAPKARADASRVTSKGGADCVPSRERIVPLPAT
jgi:hypothetical protein